MQISRRNTSKFFEEAEFRKHEYFVSIIIFWKGKFFINVNEK